MNQKQIERAIELLCQKGCKAVWQDIEALSAGQILPETEGLNAAERERVLKELKAIMSVYAYRCRVDSDENCA